MSQSFKRTEMYDQTPTNSQPQSNPNQFGPMSSQDSIGRNWDTTYGADSDGMINILDGQAPGPDGDFEYPYGLSASQGPSYPATQSSQTFNFHEFDLSQPQIPTLLSGSGHSSQPPSVQHSPTTATTQYPQHIDPNQLIIGLAQMASSSNDHNHNPYPTPTSAVYNNDFDQNFGNNNNNNGGVTNNPNAGHHRSESGASGQTGRTTRSSATGGSEYDYSATDVSEDGDAEMEEEGDEVGQLKMGKMGLKGEKTWTQYDQDNVGTSKAKASAAPSKRAKSIKVPEGEEDRLEHRRQINRRSAQKHRARRKEEHDELNAIIANRDARIKYLEEALAIERAKNDQLKEIYGGKSRSKGSGSRGGSRSNREKRRDESEYSSSSSLTDEEEPAGKKTEPTKNTGNPSVKGNTGRTIYGDGRDGGW